LIANPIARLLTLWALRYVWRDVRAHLRRLRNDPVYARRWRVRRAGGWADYPYTRSGTMILESDGTWERAVQNLIADYGRVSAQWRQYAEGS
jgi:hypothetical protein